MKRNNRIAALIIIVLMLSGGGCGLKDISLSETAPSLVANDGTESVPSSEEILPLPCESENTTEEYSTLTEPENEDTAVIYSDAEKVPEYSGTPYYVLNNNMPYFDEDDFETDECESYSELDTLGRCGSCSINVSRDTMPTEPRGEIGGVKPSGWHTVRYDDIIEDKYLYNRCHIIAYQLSGKNDDPRNLITGTRYMNIEGMAPFENEVSDYVRETGNHVYYRVTPVFNGDDLVASGVVMEAKSAEDDGDGICFTVYVYNCQPGIVINYADGSSEREVQTEVSCEEEMEYVLNLNTRKFHYPYCESVNDMSEKNKKYVTESREELIKEGYIPCGRCNP